MSSGAHGKGSARGGKGARTVNSHRAVIICKDEVVADGVVLLPGRHLAVRPIPHINLSIKAGERSEVRKGREEEGGEGREEEGGEEEETYLTIPRVKLKVREGGGREREWAGERRVGGRCGRDIEVLTGPWSEPVGASGLCARVCA